jgi:hypothetical protein
MRRDPVNQAASSSGDAGSGDESSGEALQRREAARHDEEERRVELVLRLVEVRGRTVVGYDAVWVCSVPNAHRLLLRGSSLIVGVPRVTTGAVTAAAAAACFAQASQSSVCSVVRWCCCIL